MMNRPPKRNSPYGPRNDRFSKENAGPRRERPAREPSARDAALEALQDVLHNGAYAAQALSRQLDESKLSAQDRRLAARMFYAAAENRLWIDYALSRFYEHRPTSQTLMDIMHLACAQIMFLDRVPDHAAVNEAVVQAKSRGLSGMSAMLNGVLRSLTRAREEGDTLLPNREDGLVEFLSIRYSAAVPVVKRLISAYGEEGAEAILAHTPLEHSRTIVRPNLLSFAGSGFEDYLLKNNIAFTRGDLEDSYVVSGAGDLSKHPGYRQGLFSIQGESSMLAALACEPKAGMQILDACAAPGGKSAYLCEKMRGTGRVFAWDVHEHRVNLIQAAKRRLKLDNLRPSVRDARMSNESMLGMMDAVLVDAPCSGLGVIYDKPDIKYRLTDEQMDSLTVLQAQILDNCAAFVRNGGLLVYSTCTILPEENAKQVEAFLARHPEFVPEENSAYLPQRLRPLCVNGMAQFIPHRDNIEGFFIARMRKKG